MRLPRTLLLSLILASVSADALQFTVNLPLPFVYIRVGNPGGVQTVDFDLGTEPAGTGTPIVGTPSVPIQFIGRRFFFGGSNYIVTVDSSTTLDNGNGASIPFSEFSWTTADGEFPDGRFDNSANQELHRYTGPILGFADTMTFSYGNDSVYPGGTYAGRITFTVSQL